MADKSKQQQYTEGDLQTAITKIQNNELSFREAEKLYKIPRSTLFEKSKNFNIEKCKNGPKPVITLEEEKCLVIWIESTMKRGFPRQDSDLLDQVQKNYKCRWQRNSM